jgi:hypothetical protein
MSQAIAGVSPASVAETTIMTTWPSIGARPSGQALGRAYLNRAGLGNVLTVGHFIALISIPHALLLYFLNLNPLTCLRYRLTNRRVVIEQGLRARVIKEVPLDNFDAVTYQQVPGQEWYRCANLIFTNGKVETLRLEGVPHAESFRQTCLKAMRGYAGVKKAVGK